MLQISNTMYLRLVLLGLYVPIVLAQGSLDPVRNLCKRWGHQSVYKNGSIYIDGGDEIFTSSTMGDGQAAVGVVNGYNNHVLALDLTRNWDWRMNLDIYTSYPMPATGRTPNGNQIPIVQRGALFAGTALDRSVCLYGGSCSYLNISFPGATPGLARDNSLFCFDLVTHLWGEVTSQSMFGYQAQIPNAGASVEATDLGLAFYIGGQVDNGSSSDNQAMGSRSIALGGMTVLNFTDKTAKNYSTTSLGPPRTRGQAAYVRNLGLAGALVYLGGLFQSAQNSSEYQREKMVSFQTISILDINRLFQNSSDLDPVWYQQNATGQIPQPRADFCIFSTSAADDLSHQIYIYGGQDGQKVYDDIYQLTLPSCTWFKVFEGVSPRMHHTCHVVAGSQLITLGGISGEPGTPGFSSICDWEFQSTAVYDLNAEEWGSSFNATAPPYLVSANLSKFIGGNQYGDATLKSPSQGFTDTRLAKMFTEKRPVGNGTTRSNNPSPDPGMKTSTLIAIIVSIVGVFIFSFLCFMAYKFLIEPYRRRRARERGKLPRRRPNGPGVPPSDITSQSGVPGLNQRVNSWRRRITLPTRHDAEMTTTMIDGQDLELGTRDRNPRRPLENQDLV